MSLFPGPNVLHKASKILIDAFHWKEDNIFFRGPWGSEVHNPVGIPLPHRHFKPRSGAARWLAPLSVWWPTSWQKKFIRGVFCIVYARRPTLIILLMQVKTELIKFADVISPTILAAVLHACCSSTFLYNSNTCFLKFLFSTVSYVAALIHVNIKNYIYSIYIYKINKYIYTYIYIYIYIYIIQFEKLDLLSDNIVFYHFLFPFI